MRGEILSAQASASTDPAGASRLTRDAVTAYRRAGELDAKLAGDVNRNLTILYAQSYEKGVQAYNRGRETPAEFATAISYFETASAIQPDSADAYVSKAYALISASRQAEAIEPFQTAIQKGENTPETYLYLAQLLSADSTRRGEAVTVLESAGRSLPDNTDIQTQLLAAYVAAGQTDRAMQSYQTRIQAEPNNAVYRYNYGSLLLAADRFEDAVQQLQEAVRIDPENGNAQYNLGAAYINQAVVANTEIQAKEDALRTQRSSISAAQRTEREAEIKALVDRRTGLFRSATPALTRAREIQMAAGTQSQETCRALFQALANSGQAQQAQQYSDCAGYGN